MSTQLQKCRTSKVTADNWQELALFLAKPVVRMVLPFFCQQHFPTSTPVIYVNPWNCPRSLRCRRRADFVLQRAVEARCGFPTLNIKISAAARNIDSRYSGRSVFKASESFPTCAFRQTALLLRRPQHIFGRPVFIAKISSITYVQIPSSRLIVHFSGRASLRMPYR